MHLRDDIRGEGVVVEGGIWWALRDLWILIHSRWKANGEFGTEEQPQRICAFGSDSGSYVENRPNTEDCSRIRS
jgi:hypothetical protein